MSFTCRILIVLLYLTVTECSAADPITITVGMIGFESYQPDLMAYSRSAGVIPMVINRFLTNDSLTNVNFTFITKIIECSSNNRGDAIGFLVELIKRGQLDVFISGPCYQFIKPAAALTTFYKIPTIAYGEAYNGLLKNYSTYPYLGVIMPSYNMLAVAFGTVLQQFSWLNYSLFATTNSDYCTTILDRLEVGQNSAAVRQTSGARNVCGNVTAMHSWCRTTQGYLETFTSAAVSSSMTAQIGEATQKQAKQSSSGRYLVDVNDRNFTTLRLRSAQRRSRVFAICAESSSDKREFLLLAKDAGLNTSEYVYLFLEMRTLGYGQYEAVDPTKLLGTGRTPFFIDVLNKNADGRDAEAQQMAKLSFMLDVVMDTTRTVDRDNVGKMVTGNVSQPPIECQTFACQNNTNTRMALYANHLYDAFYNYLLGLNKTLEKSPRRPINSSELIFNMKNSFIGLTGEVETDIYGNRMANFQISTFDEKLYIGKVLAVVVINGNDSVFDPRYADVSEMWSNRGGVRPLNVPACGFTGDVCPLSTWDQYSVVIIVCCAIGALLIISLIITACVLRRQKIKQREDEASMWTVSIQQLVLNNDKKSHTKSVGSLRSNGTHITEHSHSEVSRSTVSFGNTNAFQTATRGDEIVTVKKVHVNMRLIPQYQKLIASLYTLDHDNVCKFVGFCLDSTPQYMLWKYCDRGTLREVLDRHGARIDGFFMGCMITDLINGLHCIHQSQCEVHGNISSLSLHVNERWQIKIAEIVVPFADSGEKKDPMAKLYYSPERLRGEIPTQASDIYAFGIVCSEILTRKLPYDLEGGAKQIEEIMYFVKKGGEAAPRPALTLPDDVDVNPALMHLTRDCWVDDSEKRPSAETIRKIARSIRKEKQTNLMDYAMSQMEEYSKQLELEVEDQSRELVEEKKKSDALLYKMLPRQVADKLKTGQPVEPESFESVTVFFSDIVKFTQLAAKCTPFQIVNLLNDLFSIFDNLIDKHSVYKVETIGDGYLCVSGLPYRNGRNHVRDVAELALDFLDTCRSFRISHLPTERVQIRIGMNSGPCVAGVVGLAMPRYCLFGDVVNTASRMESNGKPNQIHMTESARDLLTFFKKYEMKSRGDVIIKGKGVMETHWLLGRIGEAVTQEVPAEEQTILEDTSARNREPSNIDPIETPETKVKLTEHIIPQHDADDMVSEISTPSSPELSPFAYRDPPLQKNTDPGIYATFRSAKQNTHLTGSVAFLTP